MAKGNLFLGYGSGSIGDVVFGRFDGKQVARARNRSPRNPRTVLQQLQRICLATAGKAYSMLAPLCDHSFEGSTGNLANQREFMKTNVNLLRSKISDLLTSGNVEDIRSSSIGNYNQKGSVLPLINNYVISRGTLPDLSAGITSVGSNTLSASFPIPAGTTAAELTWRLVAEYVGLPAGSQITFVGLMGRSANPIPLASFSSMQYYRCILEGATGVDDTLSLNESGDVTSFSPKNEGDGYFNISVSLPEGAVAGEITFSWTPTNSGIPGVDSSYASGWSIIASQYINGTWRRSNATVKFNDSRAAVSAPISDAFVSWESDINSSLFLNGGV